MIAGLDAADRRSRYDLHSSCLRAVAFRCSRLCAASCASSLRCAWDGCDASTVSL